MAEADIKNASTLSTNLISAWLSDSSGLLTDLVTASGNDLTNNNTVTLATGLQGDAGDFTRSTSMSLEITDANQTGLDINGTTDWSCAAWVNLDTIPSTPNSPYCIVDKRTGNSGYSFAILNDDKLRTYTGGGSNSSTTTSTAVAVVSGDIGNWIHLACSVDVSGNTAALYLNGSAITAPSSGSQTSMADNSVEFSIGKLSNDAWYVDGQINQVLMWGKQITATEVTDLYASGAGIPYEVEASGNTTNFFQFM